MTSALRYVPFALAFVITGLTVGHAYAAFTPSGAGVSGWLWVGLGTALAGCVVSALLSEKSGPMPETGSREFAGAGVLVLLLGLTIWYVQAGAMGRKTAGWEFVVLSLACYPFFLHSQRSFLILFGTDSMLFFVALLVRPSLPAALGFSFAMLTLLAFLFTRERVEEAADPEARAVRSRPLRTALLGGGIFTILFAVFFLGGPAEPADRPEDPLSIIRFPRFGRSSGPEPGPLDKLLARNSLKDPFQNVRKTSVREGLVAQEHLLLDFDRDLKFGDMPNDPDRDAIVMFIRCVDAEGELVGPSRMPKFWQMGALSRYRKHRWLPGEGDPRVLRDPDDGRADGVITLAEGEGTIEQRTILMPTRNRALFLGYPLAAVGLPEVEVGPEGLISRTRLYDGRVKYGARLRVRALDAGDFRKTRPGEPGPAYLEVPGSVAALPQFRDMVDSVSRETNDPYDRIRRAMSRLAEFQYTLRPNLTPGADPTAEFFRFRRGYCQHFASALTLLLRQMKIPARVAIGFSRGDWDDIQEILIVRARHAHAWTEVYFEKLGWVPFDATDGPLSRFSGGDEDENGEEPPPIEPDDGGPGTEKPPDKEKPPPPPKEGGSDEVKPPPPPREDRPDDVEPIEPPEGPPRERGELGDAPREMPDAETEAPSAGFDRMWTFIRNHPVQPGKELPPEEAEETGAVGGLVSEVGRTVGRVVLNLVVVLALGVGVIFAIRWLMRARGKGRGAMRGRVGYGPGGDEAGEAARAARERLLSGPGGEMMVLYGSFLDRLRRMGIARAPEETPHEFARLLPGRLESAPEEAGPFTDIFVRFRYGPDFSQEELKRARSLLQRFLAGLRKPR